MRAIYFCHYMIDTSCSIGKVFLLCCSDAKGEKQGKGIRISFARSLFKLLGSFSLPFGANTLSLPTDDEQKYMALTVPKESYWTRKCLSLRFKIIFRERCAKQKLKAAFAFCCFWLWAALKWFRQNPRAGRTMSLRWELICAHCCLRTVSIIKNKLHLARVPPFARSTAVLVLCVRVFYYYTSAHDAMPGRMHIPRLSLCRAASHINMRDV